MQYTITCYIRVHAVARDVCIMRALRKWLTRAAGTRPTPIRWFFPAGGKPRTPRTQSVSRRRPENSTAAARPRVSAVSPRPRTCRCAVRTRVFGNIPTTIQIILMMMSLYANSTLSTSFLTAIFDVIPVVRLWSANRWQSFCFGSKLIIMFVWCRS